MLDFPRFAQDHHITNITDGHHHCHQGWVQTHCPQCTDGKHGFHLGWSMERGNLHCWRCGTIRTFDYVQMVLGVSPGKAREVARQYRYGASRGALGAPVTRRRRAPKPPGLEPMTSTHRAYLRTRGLVPEEMEQEWEMKGTRHLSGGWNWRVVVPIQNSGGSTVAWCGRSIVEKVKRKYKLSDDAQCTEDPSTFLYGIHKALDDGVIIVEGPGDVWKMGPGAVATLGIGWHPEQANTLKQYERRYILYDPEPRAQTKAHELAEQLSLFGGTTEVVSGLESDPGKLSRREASIVRRRLLGVVR